LNCARALVIGLVACLGFAACDSTVTEDDLQKWTNNEVGLDRLRELMADSHQPFETKVRALEVLVEKKLEKRIGDSPHPVTGDLRKGVISELDLKDRQALVSALSERLLRHIEQKDALQLAAKDAILMHLRLMTPEAADRAQRVIAKWAFGDLSWEMSQADVRARIESRIGPEQIVLLGRYGIDGAGILLSHGFIAESMTRYIVMSGAPEANATLLRALRRMIPVYGLQKYQLFALLKTGEPEACAFLFELYRDPKADEDLREQAFSFGVQMLDLPKVKASSGLAVDELVKIGQAGGGEDRWLASANIVAMTGQTRLADVLALFKDDKAYGDSGEDPGKSVMDLCLDLAELEQKSQVAPTMRATLTSGNRIQKAIAVLCLKALGSDVAKPELDAHAATVGKPEDVSIADFLGSELTLGKLAQNANEGIAMLAQWTADRAAGKLDDKGLERKRFLTIVEFELTGDAYSKGIEERFADWLKEQGAAAPGAPQPTPSPAPTPGTPPAPR